MVTNQGKRLGFTKIELLIVGVFVVLPLLLIPPCVLQCRKRARRITCMDHQKELSLAMLNVEAVIGQFPGYVNQWDSKDVSWVPFLFPYLQNGWKCNWGGESWRYGVLVCPSDLTQRSGPNNHPLAYVVNCGRPGNDDSLEDPSGICLEKEGVSIDWLMKHDGCANTLLLSENIQAGWCEDTAEADVGIVWWDSPEKCNRINHCKDVGSCPHDIRYARPSSNHGNGVIVAFCDGHVRFLSEGIEYKTYRQMMDPDDGGPIGESEYAW